MAEYNQFDRKFEELINEEELKEDVKTRLLQALNDLNNLKRIALTGQADVSKLESEVSTMKLLNEQMRKSLVVNLIEKDHLQTKRATLISEVEHLKQQLETLDKESTMMLNDETIEQACERFSTNNQLSLMNKLQEARCKLTRYQD